MRFEALADALDEIALHLRLEDRGYQANQYRKASESLRKADFIPADPSRLPDIGDSIRDDIAEYRAFGRIPRLEAMRDERPWLKELTQIESVGPKTAETMATEHGVETIDDVLSFDDLTVISGIGPATAETIERSAKDLRG